ncbi:MAG: hypothetical protein ACM3VU_00285 [Arthrospira platensis]
MRVLIEQLRDRRARRQQAEVIFAANFAIREIKRRTIRQLLDSERRASVANHDQVIDSTVEE